MVKTDSIQSFIFFNDIGANELFRRLREADGDTVLVI